VSATSRCSAEAFLLWRFACDGRLTGAHLDVQISGAQFCRRSYRSRTVTHYPGKSSETNAVYPATLPTVFRRVQKIFPTCVCSRRIAETTTYRRSDPFFSEVARGRRCPLHVDPTDVNRRNGLPSKVAHLSESRNSSQVRPNPRPKERATRVR
jgi:hypothetical protein